MPQYLISVWHDDEYDLDFTTPDAQRIGPKVGAVNDELTASGKWVFGGGSNLTGCPAIEGWQHVCAVQEGGGARKLYVNGALTGKGVAEDGSGSGDLWIGGAKSVPENLEGVVGEIRIYRRALDASEVSFLVQNP